MVPRFVYWKIRTGSLFKYGGWSTVRPIQILAIKQKINGDWSRTYSNSGDQAENQWGIGLGPIQILAIKQKINGDWSGQDLFKQKINDRLP